MSRNLLLIAARAPVPGEAKTRLGHAVGMDRAAALYRAFLADLAGRFTTTALLASDCDLGWAYTPGDFGFRRLLEELGGTLDPATRMVPQEGEGWGARQAGLLRWGIEHGYDCTMLVASDSPHLPVNVVLEAIAALTEHDVAIGRVRDGGYYLIGVSGNHDILSGVPMSTATAAADVVRRAIELGLRLAEVSETFDVDEASDLPLLIATLAPNGAAAPRTWEALGTLGLLNSG